MLQEYQQQLESFLTTHRNLSPSIKDCVTQLDYNFQTHIIPIFENNSEIHAQYEQSVETYLFTLEQNISVYLLQEISYALHYLATTQDDYTYLNHYTNVLLYNLIIKYVVSHNQYPFISHHQVQDFMYRLLALNEIIQKRQHEIFSHYNDDEYQLQHQKTENIIYELHDILETAIQQEIQLQKQLEQLYIQENKMHDIFWLKKIFIKKPNFTQLINNVIDQIYEIRKNTITEIMKINHTYPSFMLNMKEINNKSMPDIPKNHQLYALNMGENGFSRLPILIRLPKDKKVFDMRKVQSNLVNDYNLLNQQWFAITQHHQSMEHWQ